MNHNGSSGSGKKSKRTHRQLPPPPDIPQAQLADIETRHRVYSALLNHLTLASDHKQNLLDRGLTEEAIFKFQYRTTPLVGHETIAKTLVLEGLELYGVIPLICVHAVFFPTLPFIGMTVLIPGLPVIIRYAADYG